MAKKRLRPWLFGIFAIALVGLVQDANAVIVQVNGVIVPDDSDHIQDALNSGENGCPNPANTGTGPGSCYGDTSTPPNNTGNPGPQGPLDKVNDARIDPQVFGVPRPNGVYAKVTASWIGTHDPGYRNTFGWYNVGDDLSDFRNLHSMVSSWPTYYYQAGRGTPFQSTVDFQAEFTAGNYKGGFIGFYLITPEGQAAADAFGGDVYNKNNPCRHNGHPCGYYDATPGATKPTQCIGHVYYTERELNGDGNYVHYIIYQSKVLDAQRQRRSDFYFSFEDTYRSNDVGTADDTLFVQGLVIPCVPSAEICDGKDNNCDGIIDNNPVDAGGACSLPGNPVGVGECKAGLLECLPATAGDLSTDRLVCIGEIGPKPEICNNKDDNCNGVIDDNPGDLKPSCLPPSVTVCQPGHEICVNGNKVCTGFTFGSPEICNGKDDNCNGVIDDNPVDVGGLCGSNVGACKPGMLVCLPATAGNLSTDRLVCVGGVGPLPETCNGIDDDCNGIVDDNPDKLPGVGVDCSTACGPGKTICKDGKLQCNGRQGGMVEVCNGKDDNCNGVIDDNPIDAGGVCGSVVINPAIMQDPACSEGHLLCEPAVAGDLTTDHLVCEGENKGHAEVCNGIDDNCNGIIDEGVTGEGDPCAPLGLTLPLPENTICKAGKTLCIKGMLTCAGAIGPQPSEVCNGKDDDCNGKIDDNAPCPGVEKCLTGACRNPCGRGEFACPGGQTCQGGYCQPADCTGRCAEGKVCDRVTGTCVNPNMGQSGNGGQGAGAASGAGGSFAGAAGADGSTVAAAGNSTGGNAGMGGHNSLVETPPTQQPVHPKGFGLSTGGGGCSCTAAKPASGHNIWISVLAGLGTVWIRRRNQNRKGVRLHIASIKGFI